MPVRSLARHVALLLLLALSGATASVPGDLLDEGLPPEPVPTVQPDTREPCCAADSRTSCIGTTVSSGAADSGPSGCPPPKP